MSSPNTSDSSSHEQPKDAVQRLNNSMFSTTSFIDSSPTSMQSIVLNHMNIHNPLMPMKEEAGLNMFGSSGYLNNNGNNNMGNSCMLSGTTNFIEMGVDGYLGDQNGVFGNGYNNNNGIEGELFVVPALESMSTTEESYRTTDQSLYDRDSTNNNNYFNNHNKTENLVGFDQSYFQEDQLTLGDWNFEDLMKDVSSSFPFLDFQVQ